MEVSITDVGRYEDFDDARVLPFARDSQIIVIAAGLKVKRPQ